MSKNLVDLKKLQKHQFNRVTKEELVEAILSADDRDITSNANQDVKYDQIIKDLTDLRKAIVSSDNETKAQIKELRDTVIKQSDIILQQQLFLEQLDRHKRETNLVLFGVPDEQQAFDGVTADAEKIVKVLSEIEAETDIVRSHYRLGRTVNANKPRPLLLKVDSKIIRDNTLEIAKKLKDLAEPYKKVYIKKDSHPEVRKEWKRLKDAEQEENRKSSNTGCTIRLDYKERALYRDNVVIDKWRPHPF